MLGYAFLFKWRSIVSAKIFVSPSVKLHVASIALVALAKGSDGARLEPGPLSQMCFFIHESFNDHAGGYIRLHITFVIRDRRGTTSLRSIL